MKTKAEILIECNKVFVLHDDCPECGREVVEYRFVTNNSDFMPTIRCCYKRFVCGSDELDVTGVVFILDEY